MFLKEPEIWLPEFWVVSYLEQPVAAPMECGDDGRVNVAAIETLPGDRLGWGEG